jgi:hypothetical protein
MKLPQRVRELHGKHIESGFAHSVREIAGTVACGFDRAEDGRDVDDFSATREPGAKCLGNEQRRECIEAIRRRAPATR